MQQLLARCIAEKRLRRWRSVKRRALKVQRYQNAASSGAAAMVLLEEKRDDLAKLEGQLREALAQRKGLQVDLNDSELRAPLDGLVLQDPQSRR